MAWYGWMLLGALGILLGGYVLKFAIGAAVPKWVSGAIYLRDRLRQRGFDIDTVPAPCLEEISASNEKWIRGAWPKAFHARFVQQLDMDVEAIERYLHGNPPPGGEGRETRCEEFLAQHGVTKESMIT